MPNFKRLFFFSWTTIQCLRIELQKNLPTFDVLKEIKEVRKSSMWRVFTQFRWRFCSRRRQSPSLLLKLLNFVTQRLHTKLSTKLLRNACLFQTFGWKLFNYFWQGKGCWPTNRRRKSACTYSPTPHHTDGWRADSPFHLLTFTSRSSGSNS